MAEKNNYISLILDSDYPYLDLPSLPDKEDNEAWKTLCQRYFPNIITESSDTDHYRAFLQEYKQIFRDGLHSKHMLANRSSAVRSDKLIVFHVVSFHGSELQWAAPSLQNNKDIVLAAVGNNCNALQYAAPEMKDDEEVVRTAIKNKRGYALRYASKRLQDSETIVTEVADEYGLGIEHASDRCKNNLRISLRALRNNFFAATYCGNDVKNHPVFKKAKAINDYYERYSYISQVLSGKSIKSARKIVEIEEDQESLENRPTLNS
ncbi:hypothetical protein EP47_13485 [Legionella norrlandica]|uniref:DUF4116 domain-containing protein n=1 Tax=Legionella norrlandica TaxID=1498499 RepID=A0A0A2T5J6_9GAMM|nr:DUF4116 domain-containing protein [Legionella norrlandica]KGP62713.1 hypothetical protein EP47_13485 [Legionella norrlandica]